MSHKQSQAIKTAGELKLIRDKIRDHLDEKIKRQFLYRKQTFYEFGNKAGRLLARSIKPVRNRTFIPMIRDSMGIRKVKSSDIANCFRQFYAKLYNLPSNSKFATIDAKLKSIAGYLEASGLPIMPPEVVELLEQDLTDEELKEALKLTPEGKPPGPDGFSKQYYVSFLDLLSAHFLKAFNFISKGHEITRDTLRVHISVIPKEGKDPGNCASYQPILLLNLNLKLFTKILATRLIPHIAKLIHSDQVGFLPGREARDNTTRLLNLIHIAHTRKTPTLLIAADAEKAFDRVD